MEKTEQDDSGRETESSNETPTLKAESARPTYTVRSSSDYKKLTEKRSSSTVFCIVLAGIAAFVMLTAWWIFDRYSSLTMTEFETMMEYPFQGMTWDQILMYILLVALPTMLTWLIASIICYRARNRKHYLIVVRVCLVVFLVLILATMYHFVSHYGLMGMNKPFVNLVP